MKFLYTFKNILVAKLFFVTRNLQLSDKNSSYPSYCHSFSHGSYYFAQKKCSKFKILLENNFDSQKEKSPSKKKFYVNLNKSQPKNYEAKKNEFVPSTESAQNYYDDHDKKKKDLKKGRILDRGFIKINRNR